MVYSSYILNTFQGTFIFSKSRINFEAISNDCLLVRLAVVICHKSCHNYSYTSFLSYTDFHCIFVYFFSLNSYLIPFSVAHAFGYP